MSSFILRAVSAVVLGLSVAWLQLTPVAAAQGVAPQQPVVDKVKADYQKLEYRIPMRDGVRLFTSVYLPRDTTRSYPILMSRTPYSAGPYGAENYKAKLGPSDRFAESKYIFAYQDVRGRFQSEGDFVNMRPHLPKKTAGQIDESTDTFDTIEWLVKHLPHNNGRVGMWGISYPGFYTSAGIIDAHPALKAASPQAPIADWFIGDDWHHNGAFQLPHTFNFLSSFGLPRSGPMSRFEVSFDHGTPDGYDFFLRLGSLANADRKFFRGNVSFWNEIMGHGTYDDFWKARNLRPHLKAIKPAVMVVGGWFDAENLFGALETYKTIEANNPGDRNMLVMGPWVHGGWSRSDGESLGAISFGSKTGAFYRDQIEFPFFEHYLKEQGLLPHPEAWIFETGRNIWKQYGEWPPAESDSRSLFLRAGGALAFDAPAKANDVAFSEYISDPSRPVPFQQRISTGMSVEYMIDDQRHASRRTDVLVFQTEPLDSDLTVAGPIEVNLVVSTSGTDADFVVKLIDVFPDDAPDPTPGSAAAAAAAATHLAGYQQLVRGDTMRGKFRESFTNPKPFEPNEPTEVRFRLQDVDHSFLAGHRVMVQVQSSWFPLIDRNPQTFVDIYSAKPADFQKAVQRVFHSPEKASHLVLRVLR